MTEPTDTATEAPNHYETLGVEETATPEQIRLAYRRAIKICHPDHNHGDPRAAKLFRELTGAYKILRDPEQRLAFDVSIGLGNVYRPWYSSTEDGHASGKPVDPKLQPFLEAARHQAADGLAAADIAASLIDSGCSYEAAWEMAWQARHDQMAQRMKHPDKPARSVPMTSVDGPWHPHRNSLWEKLRYGVSRIFG